MRTKRTIVLIALAVLAAVIFYLNTIATDHFYYWIYWWYDLMMHFLGGCLIGGLAAWGALRLWPTLTTKQTMMIVLISIACVGIGWEIFEYLTGQYAGVQGIVWDTSTDLLMDLYGAIGNGFIVQAILRRLSNVTIQNV